MTGSSPRVWGQDYVKILHDNGTRIIPTRVGTRAKRLILHFILGDHPHACGDKFIEGGIQITLAGSSPRVWGQDFLHLVSYDLAGIIPTRVGTRT